MENILEAGFLKDFCNIADNMYRLGWDERNAGNISYILSDDEINRYVDKNNVKSKFDLEYPIEYLDDYYFLVTGSGKYFKNVKNNVEDSACVIRVTNKGKSIEILWGLINGGRPTSELPTHLLLHEQRLKIDKNHRVVIHTHATNVLAMTLTEPLTDIAFTRALWKTSTECIVVFPEGVGVLPWMVCGTYDIGLETAKVMKDYRVAIWALHGVFGTGDSLDEAFGLIETIEKTAQVYMIASNKGIKQMISDDNLLKLAKFFKVSPKMDFLTDLKE